MNLIQRFIPATLTKTRPGYKMVPKFITIHETDNTGLKANAEAHARLQENGNSRQASWHVQVDDTQSIQSIPFNEVAWAAGDGANGTGNRSSIHLEICVNKDGDYKKAVQNASEITRQLMKQFDIPLSNVVQHNHWSGKNCPSIMRSGSTGITWNDFLNMLTVVEAKAVSQVPVKSPTMYRLTKDKDIQDTGIPENVFTFLKKGYRVESIPDDKKMSAGMIRLVNANGDVQDTGDIAKVNALIAAGYVVVFHS